MCEFRRAYDNNGDTYVGLTRFTPPASTLRPTCPVCMDLLRST